MTHFGDDLYLGNAPVVLPGYPPQSGVGPMGRIVYRNIVPLTKGAANIAALQNTVAAAALALTAGTGVTAGVAPDGRAIMVLDVARAVSLTSAANLSGMTVTVTGYDEYGAFMTATRAGPNANTVNTLKAFKSVYQVIPSATDGVNTLSVGTADIFGMQFAVGSIGYVTSVRWDEVLAADAGTFVVAVATDPSTATLGDVRGTYAPSSAANGVRRLVLGMHLTAAQCGPTATRAGALGVLQV